MKVEVQKRYCYKQSGSWRGGLGYMMAEQARLQAKHPDDTIAVELNERSTATKYRLVRLSTIEVDVPEMPQPEDFQVPKRRPEAKKLKDSEFENRVDTKVEAIRNSWLNRMEEVRSYELVMVHRPTGTTKSRKVWSTNPSWEYGDLKKQIEQELDPTYRERLDHYKERHKAYDQAMQAWRESCEESYKEADSDA